MNRIALLGAFLLMASSLVQAQTDVVGRYERHYGLAGFVVEIREDGTFAFENYTDLGNFKTSGKWRLVGPGLVIANTDPLPLMSSIAVTQEVHVGVVVVVKDELARGFKGVPVSVECADRPYKATTDADGVVEFPHCPVATALIVDFPGFQPAVLAESTPKGNHFVATLQIEQFTLRDALWYIYDGQLFQLGDGLPRVNAPRGAA